jgi:hypothetical protein
MGTVYARHKLEARPRRVILSADAVARVVDLSRSCAGLGATHQTGWTALVADLILDPPAGGGM